MDCERGGGGKRPFCKKKTLQRNASTAYNLLHHDFTQKYAGAAEFSAHTALQASTQRTWFNLKRTKIQHISKVQADNDQSHKNDPIEYPWGRIMVCFVDVVDIGWFEEHGENNGR